MTYNDQLRAAQAAIDNQSPDDDPALDDLISEYRNDQEKLDEADAWNDGTYPGDWYSEVERVMADLGEVTGEIPSLLQNRLDKLKKVAAEARAARLVEMAQDELNRLQADGEEARSYQGREAA